MQARAMFEWLRWARVGACCCAGVALLLTTTTMVAPAGAADIGFTDPNDELSVANVPPRAWVVKGLTELDGEPAYTAHPNSYYEFEVLAADDNTLWNARIVLCFHNTSHSVAYPGDGFGGRSDLPLYAYQDCVSGSPSPADPLDYSNPRGLNAANPAGSQPDRSATSQGESWRKARWVLKQQDAPGQPYGVDPTRTMIASDTTNNGTWRLAGDLKGSEPKNQDADVGCDHAVRTVGGKEMRTRWDSTLVHLKCSVRIGALARASSATDDWDLFVAVIDGGDATFEGANDARYLNQARFRNHVAYCSALGSQSTDGLGAIYGFEHRASVEGGGYLGQDRWPGYESCADDAYPGPMPFRVGVSLSIGSLESHNFGTLVPPSQTAGLTDDGGGTFDPTPEPPPPNETAEACARDVARPTLDPATWRTCAYTAHTVSGLVANTDAWKFKARSTAPDGTSDCSSPTNVRIAPALGFDAGSDYTCWYATSTSTSSTTTTESTIERSEVFAIAMYEAGDPTAEWNGTTMQANQFAFRCLSYPRDPREGPEVTRGLDVPTQTMARNQSFGRASVYVGRTFEDVPMYQYAPGATHVLNATGVGGPTTQVEAYRGMGSDNTSGETDRIWRRLEGGIASYQAYLHCRLDTSYVREGTYTGIVYLAITSA